METGAEWSSHRLAILSTFKLRESLFFLLLILPPTLIVWTLPWRQCHEFWSHSRQSYDLFRLTQRPGIFTVDCTAAEIENFLSLGRNATVYWRPQYSVNETWRIFQHQIYAAFNSKALWLAVVNFSTNQKACTSVAQIQCGQLLN